MLESIPRLAPFDNGPEITDEESAAMARAMVNLFRLWQVNDAQACVLLGGLSKRTYARWKEGAIGRASVDQSTRMSVLLGIHKSLRILFADKARAHGWVRQPNAVFDGSSALDVMLGGYLTDLFRVRHYLDAIRG
ncbi:MAG: antitoxin Xre/MbcA/ParS toxin-binding domain-containing protein [Pseudomonadota bacterium]